MGQRISQPSLDVEGPDTRILCTLSAAYNCYDECRVTVFSAHRDVSGSSRLFDQAATLIGLAHGAERAPHTNFMADIAANLMRVLERLLVYIRYEAGHPIFRWIRNMDREAYALEGQMGALKVLLEAELEWKRNNGHSYSKDMMNKDPRTIGSHS
ncbi:hypothetical protein F5887DRAFT_1081321 [Amanita rubescens]|nr:hypothetical protein F5887DRAFT_1081321 [Amanita rubescens]